jgi:hypothetical protein
VRRLLVLAPLALVAAACGSSTVKPFLPEPTAKCLRGQGFTVSTAEADVPLVASAAANGGLRAAPAGGGNTLVMAFAEDGKDAATVERAIRRVAPATLRPHLQDVMSAKRNAVLLWTVSPTAAQQSAALNCLRS